MISNTPVWIIFTYGGSMFAVALAATEGYQRRSWSRAAVAGFFAAAGILFSGVVWYAILG